jgi:hypothetical protein
LKTPIEVTAPLPEVAPWTAFRQLTVDSLDGRQRTEDGRQRTEDRGRRTDDGRQMTEDR